jgi:hypothetical protein
LAARVAVDLTGGDLEKFEVVAEQCGVEMQVSASLAQAKDLVSKKTRDEIELYGPRTTRCKKDTLSKLGYLDASNVNSKKDESLYVGVAAYSRENPSRYGDFLEPITDIYVVGKGLAEDKEAYLKECGDISHTQ